LDLNAAYRLRKQLALFVSARNLSNAPEVTLDYGAQTPAYARKTGTLDYGAQFMAGIKGTF